MLEQIVNLQVTLSKLTQQDVRTTLGFVEGSRYQYTEMKEKIDPVTIK